MKKTFTSKCLQCSVSDTIIVSISLSHSSSVSYTVIWVPALKPHHDLCTVYGLIESADMVSVCMYSCGESDLDINLSGAWGIQACFEYPPYAGIETVETATKLAEQKSKGPGSTIS